MQNRIALAVLLVSSCCGSPDLTEDISKKIGYRDEEFKSVPEGANLGLGCGNPVALASLKEGETVLDLGSGAGFYEVEVIDETSFPMECMANDPTAKAIIGNLKISPEKVKEIANSVISIKIYGVKPNEIT